MIRVGMGYDVHKLTEDRDLILGGVKIPWEKGLLGHSDADVVVHAIIIAQKPKLLPYIDTMIENVAKALHLEVNQVNIKATTEEGLGFTGSMEGISAQAICALTHVQDFMGDDRSGKACPGCCGQK